MISAMSDLPVRGSRLPGLWALAACALPIAVPASAAGPPAVDAGRGEALYATCAACHGASGMGQPDGPAPVLAAQHASVLSRQLADYRDGARWDPRMEHVARLRAIGRPQEIAELAAFISRLDASSPAALGSGAELAAGARVFVMDCAGCHGATGQGDAARGIPRLAGQHHGYLRRQMQDAVEGRRPRLQGSHGARFVSLTAAEVDGLSDYLSRNVRRAAPAPVPAPAR
jgi:cytochrome c553